ncbi:MAG: enoyl-CoA hydratase/isomerase family protein [Oscillospiraceae bacterium]|nr:enoyl-CoA hydratase/isomerase family protein [Oscillospiraceae bacterium]
MEFENIIYTVDDGIATIKLNRPKALNALNTDINQDIMAAIELVKADLSVRVLILTGSERAFAAGADVKEMAEASPRYAREFSGLAIDINNILESMPIPTIAAVCGFAFGGGFEMPLACDFRIGGPRTMLAFPECGLGIIPGANGCARATALVGAAKAKELVMLSDPAHPITGKEAYDLGLLNWYVTGDAALDAAAVEAKKAVKSAKASGSEDEVKAAKTASKAAEAAASKAEYDAIYAKAVAVANRLKARPACALAAAKAAINKAAIETIAAGKATETTEFTLLFDTHDQKEGMAAMIEKRPAVFTNN